MCSTMVVAVGGWRLAAVGGWHLATGGWWRLVVVGGGWWLAVGGWRQLAVVGSWRLVAAGGWWRLVVGGWWRLAVDGSWRLAVGGPLGLSLRAVLSKKKKSRSLRTPLAPFPPVHGNPSVGRKVRLDQAHIVRLGFVGQVRVGKNMAKILQNWGTDLIGNPFSDDGSGDQR